MKHKMLLLTILSVAALTVGCDKEQTASQQMDKAKTETKEAAEDMKDYTFAQKAEFTEKMQGQITALNKDLDQLSVKIEKSTDAVKTENRPKLQALRDQSAGMTKQLDAVRDASESTWDNVKSTFRKGWDGLKDGVNSSRNWLADKIAA
jgi:hypothetical protein